MTDHSLYFIPIIAKALGSSKVAKALRNAFRQIQSRGSEAEYAEGLENLELFMDVAYRRHDAIVDDYIRELIAEVATGLFEGTQQDKNILLSILYLHPQLMCEFVTLCGYSDYDRLMRGTFPEIALLSDEYPARYLRFPKGPVCQHLDDILPGNYKLELTNTGWILWQGDLAAKDLISSKAHEGENLRLAAGLVPPTREIDMLGNGDLILRTYAKDESGYIEIELTR
jgi:hypothetical protein